MLPFALYNIQRILFQEVFSIPPGPDIKWQVKERTIDKRTTASASLIFIDVLNN